MNNIHHCIVEAAVLIRSFRYLTAFTGAGISVESGIPPFRGPSSLWNTYDPRMFELDYFLAHPDRAWPILREIFYDNFGKARPNKAHEILARLENEGWARERASAGHGGAPAGTATLAGAAWEWDGWSRGAPVETAGPGSSGRGHLQVLITQNIDNRHREAGIQ